MIFFGVSEWWKKCLWKYVLVFDDGHMFLTLVNQMFASIKISLFVFSEESYSWNRLEEMKVLVDKYLCGIEDWWVLCKDREDEIPFPERFIKRWLVCLREIITFAHDNNYPLIFSGE